MTDVSSVDFSKGVMIGRGSRGSSSGKQPTDVEKKAFVEHFNKVGFKTKTEAVEYLLDQGWSITSICDMIRYDTKTKGHDVGDRLLPQHANHIRQGWLAKKQSTPVKPQAPTSELRKS